MPQVMISGHMTIPVWDDTVDNTAGGLPSAKGLTVDNPPTAGEAMEITAAAAADAVAGTGAQKVKLVYLDSAFALLTEEIECPGVGQTPTVDLDIARVLQFFVSQKGSGNKNAGLITLRTLGGGGNDYATIPTGANTWAPGRFTVPTGKSALFTGFSITSGDIASNDISVRAYAEIDLDTGAYVDGLFNIVGVTNTRRSGIVDMTNGPVSLPAQATIYLRSEANVAGPSTVAGTLGVVLID